MLRSCYLALLISVCSWQGLWGWRRSVLHSKVSFVKVRSSASQSGATDDVRSFLNTPEMQALLRELVLSDKSIQQEVRKTSIWTASNFAVNSVTCLMVAQEGLLLEASCLSKGKKELKTLRVPFAEDVYSSERLKSALVRMAIAVNRKADTRSILLAPFGENANLPKDFLFNNVPHSAWVRSYIYQGVADAVVSALRDDTIKDKSRLQISVNVPEVNPAFDTYRIGTLLEMIRHVVLHVMDEMGGCRVRICVQQSLGEGVFAGLPLSLSSMRPMLERMDWGSSLSAEQKFQRGDDQMGDGGRPEALIRLGAVGADQIAADDDLLIIIAPQNVIGGSIVSYLEEMVKAAAGRPLILVNPLLNDRPSSNNLMQISGRADRVAFASSFQDVYAMRLLYPSSGGYMFPIQGMLMKRNFHSPWVVYEKEQDANGREVYSVRGALDPYAKPDLSEVSDYIFRRK